MPIGKYKIKELIKLIPITKEEAKKLNKDYGINFKDYGISHSYTKYKKYFLCKTAKNLKFLKKIRKANYNN